MKTFELGKGQPASVALALGETAQVRMADFGTAGYLWEGAAEGEGLAVASTGLLPPADTEAVGSSGTATFAVEGLTAGEHAAVFSLRRPWLPEPERVERLLVKVC
jgi:predicted secreted protein